MIRLTVRLVRLGWAHCSIAYYNAALHSLQRRGLSHTQAWLDAFWLREGALDALRFHQRGVAHAYQRAL